MLTIIMSKINKNFLKLLQNALQLCYNDYTILKDLFARILRQTNYRKER